jgi:hypothetical protein
VGYESLEQARLEQLRYLRQLQGQAARVKKGVATYYDDPVAFIHDCVDFRDGPGLTPYQEDVIAALPEKKREAVRGPHGLGKAQWIGTPIPVPSGWTTMGTVQSGDTVFDETGAPCRVTAKSQVWDDEAYELTFADGSSMVTHGNHEFQAVDVCRRPKRVTDWRDHYAATRTVTTREMMGTLRTAGGQLRWRVPVAGALRLPDADLPADPYALGIWLGDGTTADGGLTLNRADSEEIIARLPGGHHVPSADLPTSVGYRIPGFATRLRAAGVLGGKHIPLAYLRASAAQRRELVRGLWDSDGYRQAGGNDEITLMNERLALGVVELLRTLGLVPRMTTGRAMLGGKDCGTRYRVSARFDFRPYHLTRYQWAPRGRQASRHTQRTITAIRPAGRLPTQCLEVDSPSHLYLSGDAFIPSHNSAVSAFLVWWFALTRDATGTDWKVVTTAGAWRQLIHYLWPEIRKWAGRLRWDMIRDHGLSPRELLSLHINLQHGQAFAAACSNPALIEGCHADSLLFIFDESKSVPGNTFDACEGAFSGTGEAYALALSTPGEPAGRFYDICSRKKGYEDWHPRHVTLAEAIAAGRISDAWAAQRKQQWGEISSLYQNRVLGEFYAGDEDCVIPLAWAEAAVERWYEWQDAGSPDPGDPHVIGVDPARLGEDRTAIAIRYSHVITEIRTTAKEDTMAVTGRVKGILDADPAAVAMVDSIGVGAGVLDRLREMGMRAEPFTASARTTRRDVTGEFTFQNCRAAAWHNLRELLDPSAGAVACLPDDEALLSDLSAPHGKEPLSGGILRIEGKDEIRARIGRSTDRGDAVVQAFWKQAGSWADVYGVVECEACGRKYYRANTRCPHCGQDPAAEDSGPPPYPAGEMLGHATISSATQAAARSGFAR